MHRDSWSGVFSHKVQGQGGRGGLRLVPAYSFCQLVSRMAGASGVADDAMGKAVPALPCLLALPQCSAVLSSTVHYVQDRAPLQQRFLSEYMAGVGGLPGMDADTSQAEVLREVQEYVTENQQVGGWVSRVHQGTSSCCMWVNGEAGWAAGDASVLLGLGASGWKGPKTTFLPQPT